MTNDEVPKSYASVVGHVCGVIAVGLAALSLYGVWLLAHKASLPGLVLVSVCVGLTALMFRWAGALTGYWDTRGRLAVPKVVYGALGVLFVVLGVSGLSILIMKSHLFLDEVPALVFGFISCGFLAYFCYLAFKRFD